MSKPLIKPVTDNKDKKNTYSIYIDMYNSSMENGYYGEAELIVYAFIEYSALGVPPIRNRIPLVRDSVPPCF